MLHKKSTRVGSEVQYGPRPVGEILHNNLENSNEPLAAALRARLFKDLHPHTELGVDLKLLTHQRGRMPVGANLNGCIRRDGEEHYTFTEAQFGSAARRNPHVFEGQHITITRRSDGSLHPNFKEMHIGAGFRIDSYALAVMNELRYGLKGLVEE